MGGSERSRPYNQTSSSNSNSQIPDFRWNVAAGPDSVDSRLNPSLRFRDSLWGTVNFLPPRDRELELLFLA